MRASLWSAGWFGLLAAGCHAPPAPDHAAPRAVVELQRYAVSKDGQRIGTLVQREIRDPEHPLRYYLVENAAGQWLGYADDQGRFYRYEPFAAHERFLGIYTMDAGLGVLYEVTGPVRVTPEVRDAAANKEERHPR
jgi:hypothetical protein